MASKPMSAEAQESLDRARIYAQVALEETSRHETDTTRLSAIVPATCPLTGESEACSSTQEYEHL
jgi:hypothetical protein